MDSFEKIVEAADTVCMNCPEDTLTDNSICKACPVRKLVNSHTDIQNGGNSMTVGEFLLHKTDAEELCVICEDGWTVATAWIDHEDLFRLRKEERDLIVLNTRHGQLRVKSHDAGYSYVPCTYIYAYQAPMNGKEKEK